MGATATVTVLFCDVVESTARLSRLGDDAADDFRRTLFGELRAVIRQTDGTEIKNLGDGLMVVFPQSTIAALRCARSMHEAASGIEPEDPVQLRIGLSVGEVAEEDGDWFGTPVVQAARLCSAASPGQTLAPALVRSVAGSRASQHRFRSVGPMTLKGLAGEMDVVEVDGPPATAGADGPAEATTAEPVGGAAIRGAAHVRRRTPRRVTMAVSGALVLVMTAGALWIAARGGEDEHGAEDVATPADGVTEPVGYRPAYEASECAPEVQAELPGADCADLVVPEDRAEPAGPTIDVGVVEVEASTDTGADPVVLVDINEPVGSTSLSEVADVYSLSLRGFGVGSSPSLDCPEMGEVWPPTFAAPTGDPASIEVRVAASQRCRERLAGDGVQVQGYRPSQVADDIRDLVLAADLGRVTLVAGGPTSIAAIAFARANPGAVGAIVLANPTEPGASPFENPAEDASRTLQRIEQLCLDDVACAERFPDLSQSYVQRFESFRDTPVAVATQPIGGGDELEVLLDGGRMGAALEAVMATSAQIGLVPTAVDGAEAELIAAAGTDEEVKRYVAEGSRAATFLSYACSYDAGPNRTSAVTSPALEPFAGANEPTFGEMCQRWGVGEDYEAMRRPLTGDVPVLIVQGELSHAGANDWAGSMAEQLEQATVVRMSTMSEDVVFSAPPCLQDLRNEFVEDPGAELDVEGCEALSPEVEFVGLG